MALKTHAVYLFADDSFAPKASCGQPVPKEILRTPRAGRTFLLDDFADAANKCASCAHLESREVGKHGRYRALVVNSEA